MPGSWTGKISLMAAQVMLSNVTTLPKTMPNQTLPSMTLWHARAPTSIHANVSIVVDNKDLVTVKHVSARSVTTAQFYWPRPTNCLFRTRQALVKLGWMQSSQSLAYPSENIKQRNDFLRFQIQPACTRYRSRCEPWQNDMGKWSNLNVPNPINIICARG